MDKNAFMKLVNDNNGFEFVIGYRDDLDYYIGGVGNKYWFQWIKGNDSEYYVGTYENGVWIDKHYIAKNKKIIESNIVEPETTINKIVERAYYYQDRIGNKKPIEIDKDRKNIRRFDTVEKALQANKTHENNEKIVLKECSGFLDILYTQQGSIFGFLRSDLNVINEPEDIYVPPNIIKINKLRPGDYIFGIKKCKSISDKYDSITEIKTVNGESLDKIKERVIFEKLVPIFPTEQIKLSTNAITYSTRIIDLFTPIGKGQRGLIVAPPKSGKTMLLKDIANGISANHPEIKLIVLLIGERPEEVTDMQRSVKGEVIASTFDETALRQTKIATFALEKAKRLVEKGEDVVILMDSITRLARAYNITTPSSGKILSGGIEMTSLDTPKKFFGTARNVENGGS